MMQRQTRRNAKRALCLLVMISSASCSPRSNAPSSGNDSSTHPDPDVRSFDALREAYAVVIEEYPAHPQSQEVMSRVLDAATRERLVGSEAPREDLMYQFPEDSLGLVLLDLEYDRLLGESSDTASAFLQRIQERMPESAISFKALDKTLDETRNESPERFLARCSDLIDEPQNNKAARVALYKRMCHYADVGQLKLAALDALRFWVAYPDVVERMNLRVTLATRLRNLGLILEADMLEHAERPDAVARTLLEEFRAAKIGQDADVTPTSFSEAYLQFAPDLTSILEFSPADDGNSLDDALFHARAGRIAVSQLEGEQTVELYSSYLAQVDHLLETSRVDIDSLQHVDAVHEASFAALVDLFGDSGFIRDRSGRSDYRLASTEEIGLLAQFSESRIGILSAIAKATTGLNSTTYASIVDRHIDFLESLNLWKQVIDAHDDFVALFPSSQEAPAYLMKLAVVYNDSFNVPVKARQIYARIVEEYRDSPEAEIAQMKYGLSLYEAEKYEDALESLREFESAYPESAQLVTAKFLSALCEAALGFDDVAEAQMRDLVRDHFQHPVAAHALFWLASASLSQKEYGDARETFQDLMERYPDSEYAGRAREYVDRLSVLDE